VIQFPYGMADFRKIVTRGYCYRDRTGAIPFPERAEPRLFIRPRRFGKSLLPSMLENCYDAARKDRFDGIFGGPAIGESPTASRNPCFVLRWDVSCIDPTGSPEDIRRSLYNHVNGCILNFVRYYRDRGHDPSGVEIDREDALYTIQFLAGAVKAAGRPACLLIDEYDNFANTVMTTCLAPPLMLSDIAGEPHALKVASSLIIQNEIEKGKTPAEEVPGGRYKNSHRTVVL